MVYNFPYKFHSEQKFASIITISKFYLNLEYILIEYILHNGYAI